MYRLDTKTNRYIFENWRIIKYPIWYDEGHYIENLNRRISLYKKSETFIFDFRKFWKGFQPSFNTEDIQMLLNKIELLEEDIEIVHLFLDDLGAKRTKDGDYLSIIGRINNLKEK